MTHVFGEIGKHWVVFRMFYSAEIGLRFLVVTIYRWMKVWGKLNI